MNCYLRRSQVYCKCSINTRTAHEGWGGKIRWFKIVPSVVLTLECSSNNFLAFFYCSKTHIYIFILFQWNLRNYVNEFIFLKNRFRKYVSKYLGCLTRSILTFPVVDNIFWNTIRYLWALMVTVMLSWSAYLSIRLLRQSIRN